MNDFVFVPPELLMGEASLCPFLAIVAVAHVYQRNRHMNGWQSPPNKRVVWAALLWPLLPDPTDGARYVFSGEDMERPAVRRLVGTGPPKRVMACEVGRLVFY